MWVKIKATDSKSSNLNKKSCKKSLGWHNIGFTLLLLTLLCQPLQKMNLDFKNSLSNLTFTCINCNSLNMSNMGTEKQKVKLYGIVSTRSDIIMLSDIRLGNNQGVSCAHELEKLFSVTPYGNYKFLHNSNSSSRGVGILINNKINFSVIETKGDEAGNILLVSAEINGNKITLGAIYGPNQTDETFFGDLRSYLTELGDQPVIIGGGLELYLQ